MCYVEIRPYRNEQYAHVKHDVVEYLFRPVAYYALFRAVGQLQRQHLREERAEPVADYPYRQEYHYAEIIGYLLRDSKVKQKERNTVAKHSTREEKTCQPLAPAQRARVEIICLFLI